ncbi:phage tail protein [Bartonella sp. HY761]|uniref:phage tail protein n=1 Tax=Bartonella sp. HY761 TaxID=2979330 RepID=UPI0021FA40CF|nr:phage tail protein [Bartonella sp. HY761]UXN07509.1 phage tail protein [Bartonella sp. HY761]
MLLSYLGSIVLGSFGPNDYMTGPTSDKQTFQNSWARHDVIRGKPVLQAIGRELDERVFEFFFDETFCNPSVQWARLMAAYLMKTPMPFISQAGFAGMRYVVETLDCNNLKTTKRGGKVVRMECSMTLIEAPMINPLDALMGAMRGSKSGGAATGTADKMPNAKK